MDLAELLDQRSETILDNAAAAMKRVHMKHYEERSLEDVQSRFLLLYQHVTRSVETKNATAMIRFTEELARERFSAGFDLQEVQTAFNVLEEAIWKEILDGLPPSELAQALGLVSTVLGMAKDKLARTYVALASGTEVRSLDLRAMFKGTDGI